MTPRQRLSAAVVNVPPNVQGMFFMTLAAGIAASMHATVRHASAEIHPFELYFFRQVFAVIFLVPVFMKIGLVELKTVRVPFHISRGVVQALGGLTWFWALSILPLAKVTALNLSTALFAVLGAILILGEKPDRQRIFALLLGFSGVLVIVRPGYELVGLGVVLVLSSRVFSAAGKLFAKSLAATERTPTIVLYTACTISVISFIPALFVWRWPNMEQFGWMLLIGAFGALTQLTIVKAYKLGDIGAVEPFSFFRLVWASLFGLVFFAEVPSIWIWIGGTMIVAAGSYLAKKESAAGKKAMAAQRAAAGD